MCVCANILFLRITFVTLSWLSFFFFNEDAVLHPSSWWSFGFLTNGHSGNISAMLQCSEAGMNAESMLSFPHLGCKLLLSGIATLLFFGTLN